jgi:hypothetical protein
MNGKTQPVLVDKKAVKVKSSLREVNQKFQKQSDWSFVPGTYIEFIKLCGSLLFIPVALLMGIMEGIRAGFIAGLQKTLALYKA